MTTVYFIRHAQADNFVRDGRIRPLTEKRMNDRALVTEFLKDKNVDVVLSSPFKRAIYTIKILAPWGEVLSTRVTGISSPKGAGN